MAHFDSEWKKELKSHLDEIENFTPDQSPEGFFAAERAIFYAAVVCRKLIENGAVTDKLKSRSLRLQSYAATTSRRQRMIFTLVEGELLLSDHFDFQNSAILNLTYYDLCSEVIHSDAFVWIETEAPLAFAVTSHRNSEKRLTNIPLDALSSMARDILADSPTRWYASVDLKSGKVTHHAE